MVTSIFHDYIFECDFIHDNYIKQYQQEIIHNYFEIKNTQFADSHLKIKELHNYLKPHLVDTINQYFNIPTPTWDNEINVYVQDNINTINQLHSHIHVYGALSTVFYTNIPKEGGEIRFILPECFDVTIKPKINKLYIFPMWLHHTPLPQQDNTPRISFNWSYPALVRPIDKIQGKVW